MQVLKYLKYAILVLIVCNLPSYLSAYFDPRYGSLASYATSGFLVVFFFLARPKHRLVFPFILLGILYFTISSFNFSQEFETEYLKDFLRYMIVAVCAGEVLIRTSRKELFFAFFIGALSVILNAFIFKTAQANFAAEYGRYSGFYLNPNYAGIVCLAGYALSFAMKNRKLKLLGFFVFTLAGLVTLSRTFVVIWLIINFAAIYNNRKNAMTLGIGGIILIIVFSFSGMLTLNTSRFTALKSIFSSEQTQTTTITAGGRGATWSYYYDMIMENPLIGNGYRKLQSQKYGGRGVHNSYLMVVGESGFLPFLIMVGIYMYLLLITFKHFKEFPEYFYLTIVVVLAMAVSHSFFVVFLNVLISIFVYVRIRELNANKEAFYTVKVAEKSS